MPFRYASMRASSAWSSAPSCNCGAIAAAATCGAAGANTDSMAAQSHAGIRAAKGSCFNSPCRRFRICGPYAFAMVGALPIFFEKPVGRQSDRRAIGTSAGRELPRACAASDGGSIARQHFAPADAVGLADQALRFHAFDQSGGPVVTDLQTALNEAGGGFAFIEHDRDRVAIEFVALSVVIADEGGRILVVRLGNRVDVLGFTLRFQRLADRLDLGIGDERTMHPRDAAARRHE